MVLLVELQNTCKKKLNRKCLKDPTYAIFLKSWGFKDVKYDIPMCQSHSTRPQPIQLVPTMQKKLFMSSFQAKFLNWVKKSYMYMLIFTCNFFVLSVNQSRATFGPNKSPLLHPKNAQNGRVWAQNGKKCTVENCSTTYIYPKTKNNCSLFSSNFHVQRPVSKYGRLKLKFLWERFSQ